MFIIYVFPGRAVKLDPTRIELLVDCGNEASLRELFEHFYGRTFAAVMALVRNREGAEDLTQEAFIRAFQRLKSLREPAKFGSWVAAIATNLARDSLKRENKYILTSEPFERDSSASSGSFVEEQVLKHEKSQWVRSKLQTLSSEQYQVIILFYYSDQKIEDIAQFLDISTGTVKSRLHRARQKLSEILHEGEQNGKIKSLLDKDKDVKEGLN